MINVLFNNIIFCWVLGLFLILAAIFAINIYAKDNLKQFLGYLSGYMLITLVLTVINVLFVEIHWSLFVYLFYSSVVLGISTAKIDISMRKKHGM